MHEANDHILLAFELDGKGGGVALKGNQIAQKIKDDVLAWVHMDANSEQTRHFLESQASYLDSFVIEALLAEETRPRMTQVGNGILLNLRGVNMNQNASPEDMVSIRMWVDKHRIISVRKRKLKAVWDVEEKIRAGLGPKDAGHFIAMLAASLFERMEPVLTVLDERTDDVEEQILEKADTSLREEIVKVRKQAIMLRRYMLPQRDAMGQLKMLELKWFKEEYKRHIYESHNQVTRYIEDLDAIRERAQIVKDELANNLADKLNRNMYVLSVIAAIFLPLGFLTGLLGINVGGIPGADNEQSFVIFCTILTALVLLQVALFKKLKWF